MLDLKDQGLVMEWSGGWMVFDNNKKNQNTNTNTNASKI